MYINVDDFPNNKYLVSQKDFDFADPLVEWRLRFQNGDKASPKLFFIIDGEEDIYPWATGFTIQLGDKPCKGRVVIRNGLPLGVRVLWGTIGVTRNVKLNFYRLGKLGEPPITADCCHGDHGSFTVADGFEAFEFEVPYDRRFGKNQPVPSALDFLQPLELGALGYPSVSIELPLMRTYDSLPEGHIRILRGGVLDDGEKWACADTIQLTSFHNIGFYLPKTVHDASWFSWRVNGSFQDLTITPYRQETKACNATITNNIATGYTKCYQDFDTLLVKYKGRMSRFVLNSYREWREAAVLHLFET